MAHNKNNPILGKGKPIEKKGTFGFACRNQGRPVKKKWWVWFGLVWSFFAGLGLGFKLGERCGTVVLLCISIYSHKQTVVNEYNIVILYLFKI